MYDPPSVRPASAPERLAGTTPAGEWRLVERATGYRRISGNGVTTFGSAASGAEASPGRLLRCRAPTETPGDAGENDDASKPISSRFGPIFDADNHYWETSDAFTRHRKPEFLVAGFAVLEVTAIALRYFIRDKPHEIHQGQGMCSKGASGSVVRLLRRPTATGALDRRRARMRGPCRAPGWARQRSTLANDGRAGRASARHGCFPRIRSARRSGTTRYRGRHSRCWRHIQSVARKKTGGFAYRDRIFAAPFPPSQSMNRAVAELEWCLAGGSGWSPFGQPTLHAERHKIHSRSDVRPILGKERRKRTCLVTVHAGFDDGYRVVDEALARVPGASTVEPLFGRLDDGRRSRRSVREHRGETPSRPRLRGELIVTHGLFDQRSPNCGWRSSRAAASGVEPPTRLFGALRTERRRKACLRTSPVDQFIEHC